MARTAEREAQQFWREVLGEHPTPEQIAAELHDYYLCIQEVPKVYDELTQGRFSKPHTMAQYIIDRVAELEAEAITEAEEPLRDEITQLREALRDMLEVADRERKGYTLPAEEWYARRDAARALLPE